MRWPGLIEAYRDRLPVSESTPVITLCEGNTPLVAAPALSDRTGCEVFLKVEGANPTGSFVDGWFGEESQRVLQALVAKLKSKG